MEQRTFPSPVAADALRGDVVVELCGEIDLSSSASLAEMLASAEALESTDLVIDLSQVTFMDTASADRLVQTGQSLAERSCALVLRSPQPIVRKVLVFCGATEEQIGVLSVPVGRLSATRS